MKFKCRMCGNCCRIRNGIVRVSNEEIARIAAYLGRGEADFIERETELAPDRGGLMLKSSPDGACSWLTPDNLCRINQVKPDKCRTFPLEWTNQGSSEICPALRAQEATTGDERGFRRLAEEDYSPDAVTVAKALVGAWLCRRLEDGTILRRRITETEAYCGEEDTACHAHKGRTARTDVMFAAGGRAYIYLCYGMHEMLNVVTGREGHPEAVLVRGVEGAEGPGKLTKLFKIDRSLNREDLVTSDRLWLESDGSRAGFTASPRIGIAYASPRDQKRKWRFTLKPPRR